MYIHTAKGQDSVIFLMSIASVITKTIDLFNETVEYMESHDDMEGYLHPQE